VTSPTFIFEVGENKKTFTLHAAAVENVSAFLKGLIDSAIANGQNRVFLPDFAENAFARFAQYVYTLDYEAPEPVKDHWLEVEAEDAEPAWGNGDNDEDGYENGDTTKEDGAIAGDSWGTQHNDGWGTENNKEILQADGYWATPTRWYCADCKEDAENGDDVEFEYLTFKTAKLNLWPSRTYNSEHDFTETLLAHAHVFDLADKYEVDGLKQLALKKLHRELSNFTLHRDRVGDVVKLFDYAWEGEWEGEISTAGERGLRWLLKQYILWKGHELVEFPVFTDFLYEAEKELSVELFSAMAKRQYNNSGMETPQSVNVPYR
jgi:hypothetical protein